MASSSKQLTISPEISETFSPMTRLHAGDDHGPGTDHPKVNLRLPKSKKEESCTRPPRWTSRATRRTSGANVVSKKGSCMHSGDFKPKETAARQCDDSTCAPVLWLTHSSGGDEPYFLHRGGSLDKRKMCFADCWWREIR